MLCSPKKPSDLYLLLLQTLLSFAHGRPSITWSCMSWPSTASSEPSCDPPSTSNHLPQAPSLSFKWNYSERTYCNEHKKWKNRKKTSPKKVLFHWILLILQLSHLLCSCLGPSVSILIPPLALHFHSKNLCILFFYLLFSSVLLLLFFFPSSRGNNMKLTQARQPQIEFKSQTRGVGGFSLHVLQRLLATSEARPSLLKITK